MTKLRYVGPDPQVLGIVPLPEGWPAADHEEHDHALAAEKLRSGSYKRAEHEAAPKTTRSRGKAKEPNHSASDAPAAADEPEA